MTDDQNPRRSSESDAESSSPASEGRRASAGHNERTTAEAERARRLEREAAQREHPDLVSSHKRETGSHGLHASDAPELRRPLEDDASADRAEHEGSWPEDAERK